MSKCFFKEWALYRFSCLQKSENSFFSLSFSQGDEGGDPCGVVHWQEAHYGADGEWFGPARGQPPIPSRSVDW